MLPPAAHSAGRWFLGERIVASVVHGKGITCLRKKRSKTVERELKATIKKLKSDFERADARAERWKKKAGQLKKTAAESEAKVKKLRKLTKRLEQAPRAVRMRQEEAADGPPIAMPKESPSVDAPSPAVSPQPAASPDASWTVVQLRAEARSRGIAGLSGKSKTELLAALR
jgi:hypothetical protein